MECIIQETKRIWNIFSVLGSIPVFGKLWTRMRHLNACMNAALGYLHATYLGTWKLADRIAAVLRVKKKCPNDKRIVDV